ncbi:MAG TPA: 5-formyltetrahydrofolate cyclo-ligase [Micromonosporaceae bacterium]
MPEFSDEAQASDLAKVDVRRVVLARRRAMPAVDRAAAAVRVQAELAALVRRMRPGRVTAYVPVGSEPGGSDLPDVLAAALAPGSDLLLPVLLPDLDLDWGRYAGPGTLAAAGRGLREPRGDRLGVAAVASANLVVVPALAVDRYGTRLGRGGGSYDRVLARVAADALTVALLHDGELVDRVPVEPHDRRVRAVITPRRGLHGPGTG